MPTLFHISYMVAPKVYTQYSIQAPSEPITSHTRMRPLNVLQEELGDETHCPLSTVQGCSEMYLHSIRMQFDWIE